MRASMIAALALAAGGAAGCNPNPPVERKDAPDIQSKRTEAEDMALLPDPDVPYLPLDGTEPGRHRQRHERAGEVGRDRAGGQTSNTPGESNTGPGNAEGNALGTEGRPIGIPRSTSPANAGP
jgi:hypothetical protein